MISPLFSYKHQPYCWQVALQQSLLPLRDDGQSLTIYLNKVTNYFSVHCLHQKEVVYVYGTKDPFLTDTRLKEITQLNQQLGLIPHVLSFEGKHELNAEVLKKISEGRY